MSDDTATERGAYYAKGDSWATDRARSQARSLRLAWGIAAVAVFVTICLAIALAALLPLKTVQPYTLLVDRQTGHVEALRPLEQQLITGDAALTRSFLVQYVIAREGFDIAGIQDDYRKVVSWSSGAARNEYVGAMQVSNPESPLVRYPRSAIIDVRIRSVSSLGTRRSMVRYDAIRRDTNGSVQPTSWVAVIAYRYNSAPMSVEDRLINPLGFEVTRYRRNVESPPELQPTPGPQIPTAGAATSPQQPTAPLSRPTQ